MPVTLRKGVVWFDGEDERVSVTVGRCVFTFPAGVDRKVIDETVRRAEKLRAGRPASLRALGASFSRGALAKALQNGECRVVAS